MRKRILIALVTPSILLLLTGCPKPQAEENETASPIVRQADAKSTGAFADLDPWVLKTSDSKAARGNHGIYIGNGFMGMTVNGEGLPADAWFIAGRYVERYDANEPLRNFGGYLNFSSLSPVPLVNGKPMYEAPYEQTLDMRTGILTTKVKDYVLSTLAVPSGVLVLHNQLGEERSRYNKETLNEASVGVTADGQAVVRSSQGDGGITTFFAPNQAGRTPAAILPENLSFQQLVSVQQKAWAKRWADADITIDGDPEAQQLVHKLQFDLMQSARPGGDDSIAPEALSGDFYKGHIFWDAEVWMLPALLPQRPDLARTILDYRFKHLAQAQAQAKAQGCRGADFPWESAASGKETAPGGFSKGRHVTAGVGWATWHYWLATGDKKWMQERGWPLLSGVADYFATRAKKNAKTGKYDIANVTGPDELQMNVTNNTYTNAMAQNCLRYATEAAQLFGKPTNPQWKTVADNIALPFDKSRGVYLKCDGDTGKPGVKQADGELLLWPAQLPMDAKTQAGTFDFHKTRVIKNGPAMTTSIHALVAARLGRADEAEQDFRDSYRPFIRGPFLLFSEKRSLDRCVFTTGAGGVLQSVLYGFGGLDYTQKSGVIPGSVVMPKGWKKLTITGIYRGGKRYTLTVTPEGRKLTPETAD